MPDQHIVLFTLTITDNLGNIWISTVDVVLNSPVLDHTTFLIDDTALGNADGSIDAEKHLILQIDITNKGHADVVNLIGV